MSFLCTYKDRYILSFIAGWICINYILLFLVFIIYGTTDAANDKILADGSLEPSPVKGLWGSAFTIFFITHLCIVAAYKNEDCRIEEELRRARERDRMVGIWRDDAYYQSKMQSQPNTQFQPNTQYAMPVQQGLMQPDPKQPIAPVQNTMPVQNLAPIQPKPTI